MRIRVTASRAENGSSSRMKLLSWTMVRRNATRCACRRTTGPGTVFRCRAEGRKQRSDTGRRGRTRHAGDFEPERRVFGDGEPGEKRIALRLVADGWIGARPLPAVDRQPARRRQAGRQNAGEPFDDRRLAAARRTDQAGDAPLRQVERQLLDQRPLPTGEVSASMQHDGLACGRRTLDQPHGERKSVSVVHAAPARDRRETVLPREKMPRPPRAGIFAKMVATMA